MKTLIEILKLSTDFLKQKGIANPRRQAEDLICDALGVKRMELYTDFERPLTNQELEDLRGRLARRGKGEPNPYIHGKVEFFGCQFIVNPSVLIPRQETELLADRIAQTVEPGMLLWDLCCGSGCLGISLKKRVPGLGVTLSDISPEALEVARGNAALNGVEVEFVEGDFVEPLRGRKIDVLVCNPPYVSELEYALLDPEVRCFEPKGALLAGTTGLEFYQRLAPELESFMNPGGKVWLELGAEQGPSVQAIFGNRGKIIQDWAGKDRFFLLETEGRETDGTDGTGH